MRRAFALVALLALAAPAAADEVFFFATPAGAPAPRPVVTHTKVSALPRGLIAETQISQPNGTVLHCALTSSGSAALFKSYHGGQIGLTPHDVMTGPDTCRRNAPAWRATSKKS